MNKLPVIIIVAIILAVAVFFLWYSSAAKAPVNPAIPEEIVLFYGDGCPHCKIVDDFVLQNKVEEKLTFKHLEVWNNKENQILLGQIVEKCSIVADQVGVPFLYDGAGKCYMGDVDVINFFKEKTGIK